MSVIEEEVLTKQDRIATNAKRHPAVSFTALAYHIDRRWLYSAYKQVRKDGAVGVDGVTAEMYAENLRENMENLENGMKSGRYKAPPVRRTYIPKGEGEKRPIGITTFGDKVAQKAMVMVLEPLYEQDFYDFSYGFRPGKSQHMALNRIWKEIMKKRGAHIIDLDISKYFDTIDHRLLRETLQKRVKDGVIIRMIGKWLKAGVMEEGKKMFPKEGTPQGGVVSPILSNIYLHEVLDSWFVEEVKPRLKGEAAMVRFADDATLIFQNKQDVERVLEVLPKRLAKYGLTMNKKKTKAHNFFPPRHGEKKPGTFNFLGFTHYWGKSRKGNWTVKRRTESKRLSQGLQKIYEWCKINRHLLVGEQQKAINRKLVGHFSYFGISHNSMSLKKFWEAVKRIWMKWLNRRSRTPHLNWAKFNKLL